MDGHWMSETVALWMESLRGREVSLRGVFPWSTMYWRPARGIPNWWNGRDRLVKIQMDFNNTFTRVQPLNKHSGRAHSSTRSTKRVARTIIRLVAKLNSHQRSGISETNKSPSGHSIPERQLNFLQYSPASFAASPSRPRCVHNQARNVSVQTHQSTKAL